MANSTAGSVSLFSFSTRNLCGLLYVSGYWLLLIDFSYACFFRAGPKSLPLSIDYMITISLVCYPAITMIALAACISIVTQVFRKILFITMAIIAIIFAMSTTQTATQQF